MPSRKHEKLNTTAFTVGTAYTRTEIAQLGRVAPLDNTREWTGIVEFENSVVLFSTLDKTDLPAEHRYADVFDSDQYKWESQNRNAQDSPVIVRILSRDTPILLFCRVRSKEANHPVPFVYVGELEAVQARSQNPVKVLFNVLDYQESPNIKLAELYNWRPSGGRKLDPVEMPDENSPSRSGQGRQMDARKRQAIDAWAMLSARQHYEKMGYALKDTSKIAPYDYVASKNGEQRRVEVKGLSGGLGSVMVTAGEVRSAREIGIQTDLVIIHSIEVLEAAAGVFQGQGGTLHVVRHWTPEDDHLRPTQYEYML
jgi:hypothetical protein